MEKNSRALHVESNEPQSYREAMAMNKEKWHELSNYVLISIFLYKKNLIFRKIYS